MLNFVYFRVASVSRAFCFVVVALPLFSQSLSCVKARSVKLDEFFDYFFFFSPKFSLVKNSGNIKSQVCILLLIKTGKFLCWLNCNVLLSHVLL